MSLAMSSGVCTVPQRAFIDAHRHVRNDGSGLNYCGADWWTYVLVDEGFYDCTMGICPQGHRHMVDD
jgi:hypothetical protein